MAQESYRDPDWLRRKYKDEGMSAPEIADMESVTSTTIYTWMDEFGIERRSVNSPEDRFWSRVGKGDGSECWEWSGAKSGSGREYGVFIANGERRYAHRFSYEIHQSDPGDMMVLHRCDNPPCVNPGHLYLGDNSDNTSDAYNRNRRSATGENNPNSRLTESDVREIKDRLEDETHREIAEDTGIPNSTIWNIKAGVTWDHV